MKKISTILLFLAYIINAEASHLISSHIQITHVQGFDYEMNVILYTDPLSVPAPQSVTIQAYVRQDASFAAAFTIMKDTTYPSQSANVGCPPSLYAYSKNVYKAVVNLSPTIFNDPSGYLFQYSNCCRNTAIGNIQNPGATGSSGVLFFPPVVDAMGSPIINSSPVLNDPINEVIVNQHPFYNFYGGFDADGDSLSYVLFTPFEGNMPSSGTVNPISAPYPDPSTQFSTVNWMTGYNVDDQVHGMGTNPSPNRFQIDPISGIANLYADEMAPGYVLLGIWCQEFRAGNLMGSTFRDFVYFVSDSVLTLNVKPSLNVQTQSLSSWNADTLEFTGSPVCVQVEVTDPNDIADISLYVSQSDYNQSDYSFVQNSAILQAQDTFITALCFQPDSFLTYPSKVVLVAMDEKCYESTFDTLEFYIRFNGYSNAGSGGRMSIPITPTLGNLDLFTYLNGNPNTGGTWLDLDNTGLVSNGVFDASGIVSDVSYRFAYIDQQPNYAADTSEIELSFFIVQGLLNNNHLSGVSVYPNPAQDQLNILGNTEGAQFEIFDIQGKRLMSETLIHAEFIDISNLQEGLYFFSINNNQRGKFLIQR